MDARFRIETQRLRIRRLRGDDAPFVLELVNEPAWLRFIGDRGVQDLDGARAYIAEGPAASYARHGFGLDLVESKESGEPVGICGLVSREGLDAPDLGFAILEAESGQGYATESAAAVLDHAARELGLARVLAIASPDNLASARILAKLGFHAEGAVTLPGETDAVRLFTWDAPGGPS